MPLILQCLMHLLKMLTEDLQLLFVSNIVTNTSCYKSTCNYPQKFKVDLETTFANFPCGICTYVEESCKKTANKLVTFSDSLYFLQRKKKELYRFSLEVTLPSRFNICCFCSEEFS